MSDRLTARQVECLTLSATMTDKDIGRHLGISHHTVSLHVREAMKRLEVSSRKAALRRLTDNPLYGSAAIPSSPANPSSGMAPVAWTDGAAETEKIETGWPLPAPPRRNLRPLVILAFAAFAALITVGIVNVVSIAVGNLASHAPSAEAAQATR